jgi:hypothetical protein
VSFDDYGSREWQRVKREMQRQRALERKCRENRRNPAPRPIYDEEATKSGFLHGLPISALFRTTRRRG